MKRLVKIISLFLILGLTFVLIGCEEKIVLKAPTIILYETNLSWKPIKNAVKYEVNVNDTKYETVENIYDLKDIEATSINIKVKAIGDGVLYQDSEYSNIISIEVTDRVGLLKGKVIDKTITYKVYVQSVEDVLGFTIDIMYSADKLEITEENVNWSTLLPSTWIYDVYIIDGHIKIAVTGLEAINVRLDQNLLVLNFEVNDKAGIVEIYEYTIDNE